MAEVLSAFVENLSDSSRFLYEIKLETGKKLTQEMLDQYDGKDYTGFLVNIHETSTGVHYDPVMISEFWQKEQYVPFGGCD